MIKIKNLNKKYGQDIIYDNADYEFKEASITCFLGPSGSGKTTLLNLIAAFDKDYDGEVIVNGNNLKDLSLEKGCQYRFNNIGFVFQHYNLLKGYTALENVLMPLNLEESISEEEKAEKGKSILEDLGLSEKIHQKVETLSGGEKQRVAIGRALINNPSIILADEPTGALDKENSNEIMNILKSIAKEKTVIIITHDEDVANYGDAVIHLEDNKLKVLQKNHIEGEQDVATEERKKLSKSAKLNKLKARNLALKNIKVHITKFFIAALIIGFSCAAFVGALGSKGILDNSIKNFKEKNFFYNFGSAPMYRGGNKVNDSMEKAYEKLITIEEVENVYYQYDIKNIKVENIEISEKMPTDVSKVSMVYGNMPKDGENEIVLSPSLAKQINKNIKGLINKSITVTYVNKQGGNEELELRISGITNLDYDDFTLSTYIEKNIYKNINIGEPSGVAFYIKDFNDIPKVHNVLKNSHIEVFTKIKEVENFQKSFGSLMKLYSFIAVVILVVGIAISIVMLYKICLERHKEIGILSAIGYSKNDLKSILSKESLIFALASTTIAIMLLNVVSLTYKFMFGYGLQGAKYTIIVVVLNLICTVGITSAINNKLIQTEPIKALNK